MISFSKRLGKYSLVGVSTFLLDLLLVRLFTTIMESEYWAVVISFLLAASVNFLLSYFFVFKGTERGLRTGYVYFIAIALIGVLVIGPSTLLIKNYFGINLYIARAVVGGIVGAVNFFLNNFLNFKMGLR